MRAFRIIAVMAILTGLVCGQFQVARADWAQSGYSYTVEADPDTGQYGDTDTRGYSGSDNHTSSYSNGENSAAWITLRTTRWYNWSGYTFPTVIPIYFYGSMSATAAGSNGRGKTWVEKLSGLGGMIIDDTAGSGDYTYTDHDFGWTNTSGGSFPGEFLHYSYSSGSYASTSTSVTITW